MQISNITPAVTPNPAQKSKKQSSPQPCPAPTNSDGSIYETDYTCTPTDTWNLIDKLCGDSWDEFAYIQNYIMSRAISEYYCGAADAIDCGNEIYDNAREDFEIKESSLSENEQKQTRQYAVQLLRQRFEADREARPDYGDCRDYYNYGSPGDWILTHPLTLGLDEILGEDSPYHEFMYEKLNNGEGMLSAFNVPYYAIDALYNESENEFGTKEDKWYDFLKFDSVYTIDDRLESKTEQLAELEASIDNPEEFAKLFYVITDGRNFSPDEVMDYKIALENGEETKSLDTILGRDYIRADYAKNKIGTNTLFSVNKGIGTTLCKIFIPGGSAVAFGINTGLSLLDEYTQDEEPTYAENVNTIATEAIRSFGLPFLPEKLTSGIVGLGTKGLRGLALKLGFVGKAGEAADILSDTFHTGTNVHEKLVNGEEFSDSDTCKFVFCPQTQAGLAIDGLDAGGSLVDDISSGSDAVGYDIAQVLLNPVATFGFVKSLFN